MNASECQFVSLEKSHSAQQLVITIEHPKKNIYLLAKASSQYRCASKLAKADIFSTFSKLDPRFERNSGYIKCLVYDMAL